MYSFYSSNCLDIVFLRSWVTVPIPQFYTVVLDKLLPYDQDWVGMKTVGRLRHELGTKPEQKRDSNYKVRLISQPIINSLTFLAC